MIQSQPRVGQFPEETVGPYGYEGHSSGQCPTKPSGQIADLFFEAGQVISPGPMTIHVHFGKRNGGMVALLETAFLCGQHNSLSDSLMETG